MSTVQEELPYGVVDNHGDVKPAADFRDADGDFIEIPDPAVIEPRATEAGADELSEARKAYDALIASQRAWDEYCDNQDTNLPSHDMAYAATERKLGARPEVPAELRALFEKAPSKPQSIGERVIAAYRADQLASQIAAVNANTAWSGDQKRTEISRLTALDQLHREKKD